MDFAKVIPGRSGMMLPMMMVPICAEGKRG